MADEAELNVIVEPEEVPEVTIEGAKTPPEVPPKPAAADQADPVADLKQQHEEMQTRTQRAQEAAERARREAATAKRDAETARSQVQDSRLETITTALSAAQADADRAKADIKAAVEAGDADAQADAYERLATAKATALRLEEGKADLEARKTERREPAKREEPEQIDDPVEAYIRGRTKPTADWLRAHPDYITNQSKNAKLTAAHWDAVGDGLEPDTKEYFDHVEMFVGLKKPVNGGSAESPPKPATNGATVPSPRRSPAPPVAPGASVSTNGGGTPEVRLSAGEARSATDGTVIWNYDDPKGKFKRGDPIGVQEFARRKLARQQQGLD